MTLELFAEQMNSPIGPLVLCRTEQGLCQIEFGTWQECGEALREWAARRLPSPVQWQVREDACQLARTQLEQYFRGERTEFEVPLDFYGTPFQMKVWRELCRIPYAQTRSYKQVAEAIGSPKAVRAVGGANNRNPIPIIVPCHRVIGASGDLVGYGGGLSIKQVLLELEGGQRMAN